ncbi:MAG TPA: hypothetical protein VES19_07225 [Candidatus Limnocylindrales bacterium]|nr:hypothetical protein [Candidatus Limnocylindrales bacterium]
MPTTPATRPAVTTGALGRALRRHAATIRPAALAVLVLVVAQPALAAAGPRMWLDAPASVAEGGSFAVRVLMDSAVPTSGVQATLVFDPRLVQVVSIERGPAWAEAPVVVPADIPATIAAANADGRLATVAAVLLPPATVAAGEQAYLVVGFRSLACGSVELGLPAGSVDAILLDGREGSYGQPLEVAVQGAVVELCSTAVAVGDTAVAVGDATGHGSSPIAAALIAIGVLVAAGTVASLARRRGNA